MTSTTPIQVLSYGGGTQSIAIVCAIAAGLLPVPDLAVIADTGYERQSTWDYLDAHVRPLCEKIGLPIVRISRDEFPLKRFSHGGMVADWDGGKYPLIPVHLTGSDGSATMLRNICTGKFKQDVMTHYLMRRFGRRHCRVNWIGFSADELSRARRLPISHGSKNRRFRFPLIELKWTREKSIRFVWEFGLPAPSRSACWCCPFQSNSEWGSLDPVEKAKAVSLERDLRAAVADTLDGDMFFHRSRRPLDEVDFSVPDDNQGKLFGGCESGLCFV